MRLFVAYQTILVGLVSRRGAAERARVGRRGAGRWVWDGESALALSWESVPDDTLLDAAAHDALGTTDERRAQAARMLADERAKRVYWSFHRQWLGLDRTTEERAVRTTAVDPSGSAATQASATLESRLLVENV